MAPDLPLQTGCCLPDRRPSPQGSEASGALQELQLLVHSLTRKVGEADERYSLLQEQSQSLKELLLAEKEQFTRRENMYKENVGFRRARPDHGALGWRILTCALIHAHLQIQTFKDIIIQKDNQLIEVSQMHEQELFRLAAKSDASADLEQVATNDPPLPPSSFGMFVLS